MKYLLVSMYLQEDKHEEFLNKLLVDEYDICIFLSPEEWQYWFTSSNRIWGKALEIIKIRGKKINVITGAHKVLCGEPSDPEIIVHRWDTYWLYEMVDIDFPLENNYQYHYICMNHRSHDWRCLLVDLLHKNNLAPYGAISWHNYPTNYDWKYFKPTELRLTDSFTKETFSLRNIRELPLEYKNSFVQIVSETSIDAIFMTEKTTIPLILGKPFLVATAPGFHKFLKELGFELYTEIFDYSFDIEPNQEKRFELILHNLTSICKFPLQELPNLYKLIENKIEYNKQHALTLVDRRPKILNNLPKDILYLARNYLSINVDE